MREYPVQQALLAGHVVMFEGIPFRASEDQSFPPGALYFGSRNTGPHLLTVREHFTGENQWFVCAVENAYPFNTGECVQVDWLDEVPEGATVVDAPPTITARDLLNGDDTEVSGITTNTTTGPDQSAAEAAEYSVGYLRERETWYGKVAPIDDDVVLTVTKSNGGGDCRWEFTITEETFDHHGPYLRVRVFDEAWVAFTEVPEFFAGLAALGKQAVLEDVVGLLDRLGYPDRTEREQPQR